MQRPPDEHSRIPGAPVASIPGAARPLAVVVGALLVLQSSPGLDPAKLAFFGVALVAVSGSVLAAWRMRDSPLVTAAQPWLIASMIISAIVGLSLPVALANGTAASAWLRDAAPYLLVATAPWLALDLGSYVSPWVATVAATVAGSLATLSFTVTWLQRRNMIDLPMDRLVFPSFVLATAFLALAVARSIWDGRDRFAWAAASALVIGLLLESGTRTTLALTAIPIVLLLDAIRVRGRGIVRTALAPSAIPLLVVALIVMPGVFASLTERSASPGIAAGPSSGPRSPAATPSPPPNNGGRFGTLTAVVSGNDVSLNDRWAQTKSAWHIFVNSPIAGGGPGIPIPWTDLSGATFAAFTADTPFTVLAKFGVLGIVIWAVLGWATILTLRRLHRLGPAGWASRSALLGLVAGLVALSPFGPQLEDKGTGLALILLLGLAFSVIRTAEPQEAWQQTDA